MAFDIAGKKSIRINHLLPDQFFTLVDFRSKKPIFVLAQVDGWSLDNGKTFVDAPKVLKAASQDIILDITVWEEDEDGIKHATPVTLVKDPDGFGAMFLAVTKGEGDDAKTTLRRVTAYATEETIAASKDARHPKAEPVAEEQTESPASQTLVVDPA